MDGFPGRGVGLARVLRNASPVDPVRIPIRSAHINVFYERNDRNIDVARISHGALELIEQALGRRLQRADLAGGGHRAGVVEDERHAQPVCAPLGGG